MTNSQFPIPHKKKLEALLNRTDVLSPKDISTTFHALERYQTWQAELDSLVTAPPPDLPFQFARIVTEYKHWIDVDFIYDAESKYLFNDGSGSGHKVDSSVLEEALPYLFCAKFGIGLLDRYVIGAQPTLAHWIFNGGPELRIITKNQDFAVSTPIEVIVRRV